MKKLVSLSVCCFVLVSLFGCGEGSPQEEFQQAFEKTKGLSDTHIKTDMELSLSAQGVTMPVSLHMDSLVKDAKSKTPQSQTDLKLSMLGMEISGTVYMKDGWGYANLLGQKSKYNLEESDQYAYFDNSLFYEFPVEKLTDLTMEKGENGTKVLTTTLSDSIFEDYIADSVDSFSGGDSVVNLGDVALTATVSSDGYLQKLSLSSQIELEQSNDESNGNMLLTLEFVNPGKAVSVEFPADLDSYA